MSWRTWVRATALRLGIAEQGSVPVEQALDVLRGLEDRIVALRMQLLETATVRSLYVEECVSYDVARGNVYAATKALRSELIRLGVPSSRLQAVTVLAPLPQSALRGVRFAPVAAATSGAFGAIRVGRNGAPRWALSGGSGAGQFGGGFVVALGWAAIALAVVGSVAALTYVLVDLVNPEVAVQEAIAEHDIAIAEATAAMATEWEETRQDAIDHGIDPNTLTPPDTSVLAELATGNPLVSDLSAMKGIIYGVLGLGALWVGYKVWRSRE